MNSTLIAILVAVAFLVAVWVGALLRRWIPQHELGAETKDTVKLAMGLVGTMSALLLGLLVSSANSTYDATRQQVIQMSAKVAFLDRALGAYGPEAADVRRQFRAAVQGMADEMWPKNRAAANLAPHPKTGNAVYFAIQDLSPKDETQRNMKAHALTLAVELAQIRGLLWAQSAPNISVPLVIVVVCWIVVVLLGFTVVAPSDRTATVALVISALSAAGAIFLILELDRPFSGLMRISGEPMFNVLRHLSKEG